MAAKFEPYEEMIRNLYVDENETLDNVIKAIKTATGFSARHDTMSAYF
jgi:hypothetical protein